MKKKHFLEELAEKNKKAELLEDVNKSVDNISEERIKIGKKIDELLEEEYSKKEILELISEKTFLSNSNISSIIEEYSFHKKYNIKHTLNFSEIKIVKQVFKKKNFSYEQQMNFLQQNNLKEVLLIEFKELTEMQKQRYNHTFSLDENGEILFQSLKKNLSNQLGKKISNSELFYYALIELHNSNPFSEEVDLNEENNI